MNATLAKIKISVAKIRAGEKSEPERIEAWVKRMGREIDGTPATPDRIRAVVMMADGMRMAANLRAMQCARMRYSQTY